MGTTPERDEDESLMTVGTMDGRAVDPGSDEYPMLSAEDRAVSGTYAIEPAQTIGPDTAKGLRDRLRSMPFRR